LDGYEGLPGDIAAGDGGNYDLQHVQQKESIRRILIEYVIHLLQNNETATAVSSTSSPTTAILSWVPPRGTTKATLLKAIIAWDRIVLQSLKQMRDEGVSLGGQQQGFALSSLWYLYGVPQYALRVSYDLKMLPNEIQGREARYALLMAIGQLPEEASKSHFSRAENVAIQHHLQNVAPQVLSYLLDYVSHFDWTRFCVDEQYKAHELQRRALEAIQKWLQFGVPLDLIYNDRFFSCIFQCLQQRALFTQTVDLILEAFLTYADSKHDGFILRCMEQVCGLRALYEDALKGKQQQRGTLGFDTTDSSSDISENNTLIHYIARLVVGFAENQVRLIADHPRESACLRLVEFVGLCCQNPSLSLCALTFDFWYSLQSRLQSNEDRRIFRDVYVALLGALVDHVQYNPEDMESKDDVDQFRDEAKDVFMEPFDLLYGEYFSIIFGAFANALQDRNWARVEALLFALCAVGDIASAEHLNADFFQMVNAFPNLPVREVPIMRRTLSALLREYSSVLQSKVSIQFIGWALNFLLEGVWQFSDEVNSSQRMGGEFASSVPGEPLEAALETAEAFRDFCENSSNLLSRHQQGADLVTDLVKACIDKVSTLPYQVVKVVMLGLAHCVQALEQNQQLQQQFESNYDTLFAFCENRLRQSLMEHVRDASGQNTSPLTTPLQAHTIEQLISHDLNVLDMCVKPFDGKHIHLFLLQKVQQVWELSQQILMQFANSSVVVEALSSLYFDMFVGVGIHRETQQFLFSMMDLLTQYFGNFMHPPVVRLISFIVNGSVDRSTIDLFVSRFPTLSTQILSSVSAQTVQQLQNHSEMMQHFFRLLIKVVHVCPQALESNQQVLEGIFGLGLAALTLPDRQLFLQVESWYMTFLGSGISQHHFNEIAGPLITKLFVAMLVDRETHYGRILEYFKKRHALVLQAFGLNVLMREEFTRVPLDEKKRFLRELNQTVSVNQQQLLIGRFLKEYDARYGGKGSQQGGNEDI